MAVAFQSIGGASIVGSAASPRSTSWSHTATGTDRVVLVVLTVDQTTGVYTSHTRAVTYGGNAMTSLGAVHLNNDPDSPWVEIFGLVNPPTGAQTVAVTITGSGQSYALKGNSISYTGAGSFGTPTTVYGTEVGTAMALAVASATNRMAHTAFMVASGSVSAFSGTSRLTTGTVPGITSGDAAGASTVNFTATRSADVDYAAIGVDIREPGATTSNAGAFFALF